MYYYYYFRGLFLFFTGGRTGARLLDERRAPVTQTERARSGAQTADREQAAA